MDRPHVTTHIMTSLNGYLSGFRMDVGLYYELAGRLPQQAVLTGSETMLAAAASEGIDLNGNDEERPAPTHSGAPASGLPWLVIVDSRGRLTRLDWLRSVPYWSDILVLCSKATPSTHLARLAKAGVPHEVIGDMHVNLEDALAVLGERYGMRQVRVDAGLALNAALLERQLIDEVSLLVAPHIVASSAEVGPRMFSDLPEAASSALRLTYAEPLRNDYLWLRYEVGK